MKPQVTTLRQQEILQQYTNTPEKLHNVSHQHDKVAEYSMTSAPIVTILCHVLLRSKLIWWLSWRQY